MFRGHEAAFVVGASSPTLASDSEEEATEAWVRGLGLIL